MENLLALEKALMSIDCAIAWLKALLEAMSAGRGTKSDQK
jgi:hypothetical protein